MQVKKLFRNYFQNILKTSSESACAFSFFVLFRFVSFSVATEIEMDFQDLNLKFSESGAPVDFASASKINNNYARAIAMPANNGIAGGASSVDVGVGGSGSNQYVDATQQRGYVPNGVGAVKRTTGDEAKQVSSSLPSPVSPLSLSSPYCSLLFFHLALTFFSQYDHEPN